MKRNYYELTLLFALREIKGRYKASLLGPLWVIFNPLIFTSITTLVFSFFIKVQSQGVPYPAFALTGILLWNFFSKGLGMATRSLVSNRNLIVETKIPVETLPLGYIFGQLPDFLVNFIFLLLVMIFFAIPIKILSVLLFILLFLLLVIFLYGLSLFLSAANVMYRDTQNLIDPILLMLFYLTPIVYGKEYIPDFFSWMLYFNPIALYIVSLRDVLLLNMTPSLNAVLLMLFFSTVSIGVGYFFFKKYKPIFPDVI